MKEKIKPCPFCGGDNVEIRPNVGHISVYLYHTCRDLLYIDGRARNEADAIKAWNARAERVAHWVTLKDEDGDIIEAVCSYCQENGRHDWTFCPHCGAKMEAIEWTKC